MRQGIFSSSSSKNKQAVSVARINRMPKGKGILSGLTFTVKANIDIAGVCNGQGNPNLQARLLPATNDAPVVEACLRAGGKLTEVVTCDSMALSLTGRDNQQPVDAATGKPIELHNPLDPSRICGGSSSGSAISAAQDADFSLGTDTGGSIRVPASYCGLLGYRPSHGIVSLEGVAAHVPDTDTVGVICKEIEVLQQAASILLNCDKKSFEKALEKPKFQVIEEALLVCDEEVKNNFEEVIHELESQGYEIERISLNKIYETGKTGKDVFEAFTQPAIAFMFGQVARYVAAYTDEKGLNKDDFTKNIWESMQTAQSIPASVVMEATKKCHEIRDIIRKYLSNDLFILIPTVPFVAPLIAESDLTIVDSMRIFSLTCISSFAGLPQITLPYTRPGMMPIGFSLLSNNGKDIALLNVASRIYKETLVKPHII